MTVTLIKEIPDGKTGHSSGPEQSSITRVFRVFTDSKYDTPITIQSAMPIDYGAALAENANFTCLDVNFDLQQWGPSFSSWIVTYEFGTRAVDQEKLDRVQNPNPLDRRARVTVSSVRYSKLIDKDLNDKPFITSAGEPYPAQEVDDERWTINVRKNYTSIPDFVFDYQKKINASPITVKGRSLAEETVKFGETRVSELMRENGTEFYQIEFSLDYKRDGWQLSLLDAGFYYLDAGDYKPIVDDQSTPEPVTTAVLLDGSGGILKATLGHAPTSSDTFFYNDYDIYETADFSILPLNES